MAEFYLDIGACARFSKTVSESDVYLFAGITGDLSPNHVNQAVMEKTAYGGRIAHGALMVGYMSAASTLIIGQSRHEDETPVSLGYDRIRFLAPVFIGDTINVTYRVVAVEPERKRSRAQVAVANQHGQTVAVAEHILKWVENEPDPPA